MLALASTMGSALFIPTFVVALVGVYGHAVMQNFVQADEAPTVAVSAWGIGFFGCIALAVVGLFI